MADLSSYIYIAANTVTAAGNIVADNLVGNTIIANTELSGNGGNLSNLQVANVSGIGNIATINLDGNVSNVLYGNGTFAAAPNGGGGPSYGDSNVATFLASYGSNTMTTTGNVSVGNIIGNGQALSSIAGANVTGTVANATYAVTAGTANSVAAANITGTVNLANYATTANSVAGANVSGTVANATYATSAGTATTAGAVTTNAQPNITSVGTLTSLSATGNVTAGGLTVNGAGVVTGNLQIQGTLTYNNLTNLTTSNLVLGLGNNQTGVSVNGAGIVAGNTAEASFLYNYSSQTWDSNIGLSAVGNVTGAYIVGNGSRLSSLTGANVTGAVTYATTANSVAVANVSGIGNIATVNKDGNSSNILYGNGVFASAPVTYGNSNVATFLGSYGSNTITTTGNVSVGNIIGNGQALTGLTGANVSGQVSNSLVAGTVYTNAQPNITSTGTLTSLTVTGNINGGNIVSGGVANIIGNITGANLIAGSSGTGNVYAGNVIVTTGLTLNGTPIVANNAANLNSINTISTTGNVTVGGNLTATGGVRKSARLISGATTLTVADASGFIEMSGGPYTVTLPDASLAANSGIGYRFWQNTSSNITLSCPTGAFYGPSGSAANTKVLAQATTSYWDVWSDGFNWIVFGIKIA